MVLRVLFFAIILSFVSSSLAYTFRVVRSKGLISFYNDKDLKVKSYYIRDNKVLYVNRYYYNERKLCIKKATWKGSTIISVFLYKYYANSRQIRLKKYYYKNKFKYLVRYDIYGAVIDKSFIDDVDTAKGTMAKKELGPDIDKKLKAEDKDKVGSAKKRVKESKQ